VKISIIQRGDLKRTERFLSFLNNGNLFRRVDALAQQGVTALRAATPVESSRTANSWSYEVRMGARSVTIMWKNSHVVNGVPIAIILVYGHGTGTGGYVKGRNYINPAMKPVFDRIADDVWKAVKSA
jgi:hypothetical protein